MNSETSIKHQPFTGGVLHFAGFELDLNRGELRVEGRAVPLRPKTYALLALLAQNAGRLMSKDTLMAALWPDVVVTDDSLVQCVTELRGALGAASASLIKTVPRRGYLLDAVLSESAPDLPTAADTAAAPTLTPTSPVALDADANSAPAPATPATTTATANSRSAFRRNLLLTFASAVLLVVCALAWQRWQANKPARVDHAMASRKSIAVLPLTDLSDKPSPWFAEAVTRDLMSDIARVPDLMVITAFPSGPADANAPPADPRADPRALGRKLGAQHVLVGSVRRDGSSVQVSAQLIAVDSGVALWTDRFDYPAQENIELQQAITRRVARAMEVGTLEATARQRNSTGYTLDAADHVMEGWYIVRRNTVPGDHLRARAHFEAALKTDPNSVSALTGMSATYCGRVMKRWRTDEKGDLANCAIVVDRALAIDTQSSPAHAMYADWLYLNGRLEESLLEYETAVRLDPSDPRNYLRIGFTKLNLGRPAEMAAHVAQAQALSPLEIISIMAIGHHFAGIAEFHLGNDDAAYQRMQLAAGMHPKYANPHGYMAAIDALHGREASAATHMAEFRRLFPNHTIRSLRLTDRSTNATFLAGADRFYQGLRKAGMPE